MKHLAASLLALLLALSAVPAVAAPATKAPPDPMSPSISMGGRLQALLDRVKYEQKQLKTVEARFVQQQESSMLVTPEESKGVFSYAAPDRVRWEYQSPSPITVVIQGDDMTTWYRDLNRADKLRIGRYSNQFFKYLGASGNLQTLLDYFTVRFGVPQKKGDPYQLQLLPRYPRIAKRLKTMTIWVDSETFFPNRLKYVEADGDTTEYRFEDVKRNVAIPAERFVLKLPQGVQTRVIDLARESKSATP